ncbi:hypothetical protein HMPREF9123_2212 [Neisseria bacilliformis ATCC BAA-1200]|uniref:Uncharacterized protein n=1 Tax=Neisseria bacilliformis ATCC BAA-1200 TaxID=888742 RepID=F2BEQ5_9NEIS|nr:hypothetical protein HMPREF9123_2212 [Neisseria bacilliformis ATCC BAA-1200]
MPAEQALSAGTRASPGDTPCVRAQICWFCRSLNVFSDGLWFSYRTDNRC